MLKCAITEEMCPFEAGEDGCAPCRECETGKSFLEGFIAIRDDI